jgi:hypothetical protein
VIFVFHPQHGQVPFGTGCFHQSAGRSSTGSGGTSEEPEQEVVGNSLLAALEVVFLAVIFRVG